MITVLALLAFFALVGWWGAGVDRSQKEIDAYVKPDDAQLLREEWAARELRRSQQSSKTAPK